MPNRILREGILTSERVNALTWEAEVFYRRLMSVVDDFGRYTAHPSLLRAALYPLKLDTIRDANMERLLALVEQARLVRVYAVDGKRYLELLDFKQQVRAKESKYPAPAGVCSASATHMPSTCTAPAHLDEGGDEDVDETPQPPRGSRFGEFWEAWPKSERKQDKAKCTEHWRRNDLDAVADLVIADVRLKRGTQKWQGGFIEAPLVYLRGKRWEDGVTPGAGPVDTVHATVESGAAGETAAYLAEQRRHAEQANSPEAAAAREAAIARMRGKSTEEVS